MNTNYALPITGNFRFAPLAAALALCLSGNALAATLTVNTAVSSAAPGKCTLSDAVSAINRGAIGWKIHCANSGGAFGASDTIVFQKNFAISFPTPVGNASSALLLKKPMTISGRTSGGRPSITIARSAKSTMQFRLIESRANLTLNGVTISGGSVIGDGGGVNISGGASLQMIDAAVLGNAATGRGGGIFVEDSTLDLDTSSVSGNTAGIAGGGIYSYAGTATLSDSTVNGNNGGQLGGGLAVGALLSNGSTISGNSADIGGGTYTTMPSWLSNSTVSGNSATVSGGGVYSGGSISLSFSTISGNSVSLNGTGAGLVLFFDGSSATATIISGNVGGKDVDGLFLSTLAGDHDIVGTTGGNVHVPTDTLRCNPHLAPLMNDGGPTLTQPLMSGSCAIDTGPAATSLLDDQRGLSRKVGAKTDIGAVERQGSNDPPAS